LETTLTQKQLELEQRDRVMREQSKFLKARDELLNLLKGKQANADNSVNANYEDIDEVTLTFVILSSPSEFFQIIYFKPGISTRIYILTHVHTQELY